MMTSVALYARVSTTDQEPDVQLDPLRAYAAKRRLRIFEEYVDLGVSGVKRTRPALDRLMADGHSRRFDAVCCVKLDRIARSVRHLTVLAAELENLGIDLIVLDQGVDTTSPSGKLLFHVLGAVAEFERDLICERTRAGMAAARRRGSRIGRPRAYVPIERARGLIEDGQTVTAAAIELGVSRATLQRALKRVSSSAPVSPPIS